MAHDLTFELPKPSFHLIRTGIYNENDENKSDCESESKAL